MFKRTKRLAGGLQAQKGVGSGQMGQSVSALLHRVWQAVPECFLPHVFRINEFFVAAPRLSPPPEVRKSQAARLARQLGGGAAA